MQFSEGLLLNTTRRLRDFVKNPVISKVWERFQVKKSHPKNLERRDETDQHHGDLLQEK